MKMDHLPPPPYSETDIYSNGATSPINLTPATSQADSRSLPTPSAASSVDDSVVYTPPYTPTDSVNHNFEYNVSSTASAAYFESRQTRITPSLPPSVHSIAVTPLTEPKDLPYPVPVDEFMSKDITQQDWATFVNYLLPDYTANVNNSVAHRKLQAELVDDRMRNLTLADNDRSRTDLNQVDAQLEPLRQEISTQNVDPKAHLEETITEWNQGFFMPRGVQIRLIDSERLVEENTPRIPGAWVSNDHDLPEGSSSQNTEQRSRWGFGGIRADSRGFKMGPIVADNAGFRIGNTLVADNNGFRFGNLVADNNGFRVGGLVADQHGLRAGGRAYGHHDRHERHGREKGCGRGGRGGRGGHHRGRSHSHGRHGRHRSSSTSSSSSSSSASSSDSDLSVGSLPEYDDLRNEQLPVAKQSLVEWLNHPDQPITKETVLNIKREIKSAKRNKTPKEFDQDMKELRKEVIALMKKFKEEKKSQKHRTREARKQRRVAKRELRNKRRQERKEARKARMDARKGKNKEEGRSFPPWMASRFPVPMDQSHPSPPIPHMPFGPGSSGRGFPFGRMSSAPCMKPPSFGPPFSRNQHCPPGLSSMHAGWPYTQAGPYAPGRISVPHIPGGFPEPISHGAESIHAQAVQMDKVAAEKETAAFEVRTAATRHVIGEKEKLKMVSEATALEEEAERYRREADRLRAEALHLDSELARELSEEYGGQTTGVVGH